MGTTRLLAVVSLRRGNLGMNPSAALFPKGELRYLFQPNLNDLPE